MLRNKNQVQRNNNHTSPQTLLIRIDTPNDKHKAEKYQRSKGDNMHQLVNKELELTRKNIIRGEIALYDSRRQAGSKERLVESDRIGLSFNYSKSKEKTQFRSIKLEDVIENGNETQRDSIQESEGGIQLPLHLQQSPKDNMVSARNKFNSFEGDFSSHTQRSVQKWDNYLSVNQLVDRGSLDKKGEQKKQYHTKTPQPKSTVAQQMLATRQKLKQNINKSKETKRRKEDLNRSLDKMSGRKQKSKTEMFLLNQSYDRLPLYCQADRQSSKEKLKKLKAAGKQNEKITIRMNNPHFSSTTNSKTYSNIKPRYQICVPQVSIDNPSFQNNQKQEQQTSNCWQTLKKKVSKYSFVRKYLSQSQLFMIYQHLKRNKIVQSRWPLFVVDEAYKKMNCFKG